MKEFPVFFQAFDYEQKKLLATKGKAPTGTLSLVAPRVDPSLSQLRKSKVAAARVSVDTQTADLKR